MTTSMAHHPDSAAVAAIRGGDIDRYRDLVQRYERQVYAVAWSRLGDPELAEEASQEAFIHAYRHLAFLRDAERFGAWLTRIARGVAINLGLRRRRELRKRQRWSLDLDAAQTTTHPSANDDAYNLLSHMRQKVVLRARSRAFVSPSGKAGAAFGKAA